MSVFATSFIHSYLIYYFQFNTIFLYHYIQSDLRFTLISAYFCTIPSTINQMNIWWNSINPTRISEMTFSWFDCVAKSYLGTELNVLSFLCLDDMSMYIWLAWNISFAFCLSLNASGVEFVIFPQVVILLVLCTYGSSQSEKTVQIIIIAAGGSYVEIVMMLLLFPGIISSYETKHG